MSQYQLFVCRKCGHEVLSPSRPYPIRWTDGHVCHFVPSHEEEAPTDNPQEKKESENEMPSV